MLAGREWLVKPTYGRVPTYLQNRKMEMAADYAAKAAAREAALMPQGLRLMPEEERLATVRSCPSPLILASSITATIQCAGEEGH